MLNPMRPGDEHAFSADDPVARYWLHNCVGFGVRGLRSGPGVVRDVRVDEDGVAVLAVRRAVLGLTTVVPASRVRSVDPWDERVVLHPRSRATRERRVAQARDGAGVIAAAARGAAVATAFGAGLFLAALSRLLLALAALTRKHAPGARRAVATLGALGRAYAAEADRTYRGQKDAVAAWREARRRRAWGDESPLTRAGADEVEGRAEEETNR
jgi:hypothetical protein